MHRGPYLLFQIHKGKKVICLQSQKSIVGGGESGIWGKYGLRSRTGGTGKDEVGVSKHFLKGPDSNCFRLCGPRGEIKAIM